MITKSNKPVIFRGVESPFMIGYTVHDRLSLSLFFSLSLTEPSYKRSLLLIHSLSIYYLDTNFR